MKPPRIQRLEIEREKMQGIVSAAVGAIWVLLGVVSILGGPSRWLGWLYLASAAGFIIVGVVTLRRSKRRLAEFTAEHGPDAGKQTPIR